MPATVTCFLKSFTVVDISATKDAEGGGEGDAEPHGTTRSLEECIDVFENGPRPVSVSLLMLSDKEIVKLAQTGKITAYALEKLLDCGAMDNVKLERAEDLAGVDM